MALVPVWPGATVDVGGRAVHVRRAGDDPDRPAAVLVHGLGGNATNWTDLMAELAPRLRCTAVDLPGFGRSAPPANGRYDLDAHVRAVAGVVETLGEPVHLFGNSTGGAVATRLAAERPELVRSLVLVSPALPVHRLHRGVDARLGLLLVPGLSALVTRRMATADPEERARAVVELCFADPSRIPRERWDEAVAEARRRADLPWTMPAFVGTLRGLVASYVVPPPKNLWSQAARVRVPVLLVQGAADRLVARAVAERAARTFPTCRLELLANTGHVAQMERPETVARLVGEHLDAVDRVAV